MIIGFIRFGHNRVLLRAMYIATLEVEFFYQDPWALKYFDV